MRLTVKLAAARIGCSSQLVYRLIEQRRLPHLRVGGTNSRGKILIEEADVEAFLATCRVAGGEECSPPAPPKPGRGFTSLDGARLLEAWRRRGVLGGRTGADNALSSASSCGP